MISNNVKSRADELFEIGKENLKNYGILEPIGFLFKNDASIFLIPISEYFESNEKKQHLTTYLYEICHEHNPEAIAILTESYMVMYEKDKNNYDEIKNMKPSQSPNRIECIHLTLQGRFGDCYIKYAKIIRDSNQNIEEIKDLCDLEQIDSIEGKLIIQPWDQSQYDIVNKLQ